jgi:hypothetical protein
MLLLLQGQQQTTVTPKSPTCRFVARCSQWYPPPAPVVTCPSPQGFHRHDVYPHVDWIKVRKVCVVRSHSLFPHERSSTGTETETCGPASASAAGWPVLMPIGCQHALNSYLRMLCCSATLAIAVACRTSAEGTKAVFTICP